MNKFILISALLCSLLISLTSPTALSKSSEIIETDLNGIKELIHDQLSGISHKDLLVIKGSNLYIQEEFIMSLAQQQFPDLLRIQKKSDKEIINITFISKEYQKIILLGGETTNKIVNNLQNIDTFQINEIVSCSPFLITIGSLNSTNTNILIFSTTFENSILENKGPQRSPLSKFMDKRLTPIIATVSSITLLHIFNLFGNTISEFFFDFTSEKLGERKKEKHRFQKRMENKQSFIYIKELGSILIAIIIFSLSLSWTWSVELSDFFSLFFINIFVVGLFFLIRESLRIYYSKKYSLVTEHVFWPLGSILTFFSTLLGNTFSLTSYTALENEEREKRYSTMYLTIFGILFVLTLMAYVSNFFISSQSLQMFYVFTIMAVFIDMTPIHPMDGYEVKKYNLKKWIALYVPVFLVYVLIMFSTLF